MALKDYQVRTEIVKIPDGEGGFTDQAVRGLEPADIMYMLTEQRDALESFFSRVQSGSLAADDYSAMVQGIMADTPALLGLVIACACDEPTLSGIAQRLPLTVQVDAIDKIARLTFAAEGGAKKALETVVRAMASTTAMQSAHLPSQNGSGASAAK